MSVDHWPGFGRSGQWLMRVRASALDYRPDRSRSRASNGCSPDNANAYFLRNPPFFMIDLYATRMENGMKGPAPGTWRTISHILRPVELE